MTELTAPTPSPSPRRRSTPVAARAPAQAQSRLAAAAHLAFNILLSATVVLGCLLPLHAAHTRVLPLPHLEGGRSFELERPAGFRVEVGDELPVYRFHADFLPEAMRARVVAVEGDRLRCELREETAVVPVGRHGLVVGRAGDLFEVAIGIDHGLQPGNRLALFKDWERVGELGVVMPAVDGNPTLTRLGRHHAEKLSPVLHGPRDNVAGLAASEFTVPTSVLLFSGSRWVSALELGAFALVLALELHLFYRRGYGLLAALGRSALRAARACPSRLQRAGTTLLALTAAAGLYAFVGALLAQLPRWTALELRALSQALARWGEAFAAPSGLALDATRWLLAPERALPAATPWALGGLLLAVHLLLLLLRRQHLPLLLWGALSYRPRWLEGKLSRNARTQAALVWGLHLLVLWIFAYGLVGFVASELNRAVALLSPADEQLRLVEATLSRPESLATWTRATAHNLGVLAREGLAPLTFSQGSAALRHLTWALASVGALVGFVHSFVHALHLTTIRNVDCSLLGWLTNASFHTPLLAALLWATVPGLFGPVPTVGAGPLSIALGLVELGLGLLYVASVFNMGTRYGVMVDKGLVDHGLFSVVRHPGYVALAPLLFLLAARALGDGALWLGALLPAGLLWLRAEREEVFMGASNPGYAAYRERVPYKFIRGLV